MSPAGSQGDVNVQLSNSPKPTNDFEHDLKADVKEPILVEDGPSAVGDTISVEMYSPSIVGSGVETMMDRGQVLGSSRKFEGCSDA